MAAAADVQELLRLKYGPPETQGWGPRLRQRFGYCTPDDWYEATLLSLVSADTSWLDVGCGRYILPYNRPVVTLLAARCRTLVGVDPDDAIQLNTLLHRRVQCRIEDYRPQEQFDLITLRMVAEHFVDPNAAVAALGWLAKPGGTVVVYTVNRFSPLTFLTSLLPTSLLRIACRLTGKDLRSGLHPSFYRMNTRPELRRLFDQGGFREASFHALDDCRATLQWKTLNTIELSLWQLLRALRLHYPEICLLAVYRRNAMVARGRDDVVVLRP